MMIQAASNSRGSCEIEGERNRSTEVGNADVVFYCECGLMFEDGNAGILYNGIGDFSGI